MASEENTIQIVDLTLVPVGAIEEAGDARNGGSLVGVGLDADSGVVSDGEKVVDDLETVLAGGVVGGCNSADLGELSGSVIFRELARSN